MANKMITEQELHDDFLTAIIRSDEPQPAPRNFTDDVMQRIRLLPAFTPLKPYSPPIWLKWGIPGVFILCLIGLFFLGPAKEPTPIEPASSLFEKTSTRLSYWFTGFNFDFKFPELNISTTTLSIIAGGIILMWSFLLLSRFLEKRTRRDR